MSSIYRKGRDGYYYYQTYVFNPETGKKDKRIFHSLGTKDKESAKLKQKSYDEKYSGYATINENFKRKIKIFPFAILFFAASTYWLFYERASIPPAQKGVIRKINSQNELEVDSIKAESSIIEKSNVPALLDTAIKTVSERTRYSAENDGGKAQKPTYQIRRIIQGSNAFRQGKIFVTVDNRPDSEKLVELCRKIKNQYVQFSNIVICIYTNTNDGILAARGKLQRNSLIKNREVWMAMYSYNEVEGEYFDPYPARYLGAS
tara:strand:- start:9838 stop:10620 length:783 start_codon:yes stop_codon:yes gene_type:complete